MQGTLFDGVSPKPRRDDRELKREYMRRYRARYRERERKRKREYMRKQRAQDPERARQQSREAQRRMRERNPERARAANRDRQHRYRYGLSRADFDALLLRQHGACASCRAPFGDTKRTRARVDHDHATGKVRGLLCHGCNTGIGLLGDDVPGLLAAVAYLNRRSNHAT